MRRRDLPSVAGRSFLRRLDDRCGAERVADYFLRAGEHNAAGPRPEYWFKAKRYGYGWGLPCSWQGWVVDGLFLAVLVVASFFAPPWRAALSLTSASVLVVVSWRKGEPTRWRWG